MSGRRLPLLVVICSCVGCSPLLSLVPAPGGASKVSFRLAYAFTATEKTEWARVMALVPRTIPGRQVVHSVRLSPEPLRVMDLGENRYAEFLFPKPPKTFQVVVAGDATVFRYDLSLARRHGRPASLVELQPCLIAEPSLEASDPAIRKAAGRIQVDNELDAMHRIYDFVVEHMGYTGIDPSPEGGGALRALREKGGDCTDYADLMVALCRARGIPARPVLGLYSLPTVNTPKHSWVEVHSRQFGWVPFDPTAEDTGGHASFEKLKPHYLRFSTLRNDELLDNFNGYMMYRWWGDPIELSETCEVKALGAR